MTKQTSFSIIIVVLAIAGAVWLTIWSKNHVPTTPDPNPVVTSDESKYLVTKEPQMVSVAEDLYLLGVGGSYPQFSQADAAFNKKIADTITGGVADFKTSVDADYKARLATGGDAFQKEFAEGGMYTYEVTTDVVQSNDNYISTVIHVAGYSGGAHGFHGVMTFNYDIKNKKELISVQDISARKPQEVAADSFNQLMKKFTAAGDFDENIESMLKEGTNSNNPENFKNFTFTNDALTIYFPEYQVAPYSFGEQVVTVSTEIP